MTGLVAVDPHTPTWPAHPVVFPQVAIDHILVSPHLVTTRSGVGAAVGSDHLPVVAEIGLRHGTPANPR